MWTQEGLRELIRKNKSEYEFVVVSNRQPYEHVFEKGKIVAKKGAGGVIAALDPVMQASEGLWVAVGNGTADSRVCDDKGRIRIPEDDPKYTLKRIWLSKEENKGYYYGYSNGALWPLCHMTFEMPKFKKEDWEAYKAVNKKFADAILEELGDRKAIIWIQDYHLALLAKYLRDRMKPGQFIIAHFWHIPWPNYEAFRICPEKKEMLEGLLSNDILGFQIAYHCNNFLDVVDRELESKIDREHLSVTRNDHETSVRAYPISIDFESINDLAASHAVSESMKYFNEEYNLEDQKLVVSAERLDYTKGLLERFNAIDRMFEKYPDTIGKVTFFQMGQMTRIFMPKYKKLNDDLNNLVEDINWKYSFNGWKPIIFIRKHFDFKDILALYRLSSACIVSSLHDGMNLVTKEFISSRQDNKGMLILSQFTGAARELQDAVLVNPYDSEDFADKICQTITMPPKETKARMSKMRDIVKENNIYTWAGEIISTLLT